MILLEFHYVYCRENYVKKNLAMETVTVDFLSGSLAEFFG